MTKFIIPLLLCGFVGTFADYKPNWESLDSRPLPDWFDKAKVGIFLHWGVYSVPGFGSEWFWYYWKGAAKQEYVDFMKQNYAPGFTYQDFASNFKAEFFNPDDWADLIAKSGAKYVVLTTKHHEGYTLWPSKFSFSWNAKDVGPNRDLVGDFAAAVRSRTDLHFGLYHSLFEWFNPIYTADKNANFSTSFFVDTKIIPEMKELINMYQPEILWSDGDGEALDTYWKSTEFLAWLYNESPVKDFVVTNDRWGSNVGCKHGGYFTCADRYNPGHLLDRKWENCMTIDKNSWGYRRNIAASDLMSIHELITTLTETISCGGNILINVGPTKEGTIIPSFQQRLLLLGDWLRINGEAIYESNPWRAQNDTLTSGVWYTAKDPVVYAITLNWPQDNILTLRDASSLFDPTKTEVALLGNNKTLPWKLNTDTVDIVFPDRALVVSQWAWVLKISY